MLGLAELVTHRHRGAKVNVYIDAVGSKLPLSDEKVEAARPHVGGLKSAGSECSLREMFSL